MGFGINSWDLISQSQTDPEEEARRRKREMMMQPVEDVGDQQPLDEEPTPEIIAAPRVLGSASPETSDILGQYKDWMARRPDREALKPSTGRQILAGLAGFLGGLGGGPQAAAAITDRIAHAKENEAMGNWEEEGRTIGDVGKFAQDVSETRRKKEADVLGYEGTQSRVEAQRAGVEQRREAENLRHTDRMADLKSDNERKGEIARHNKVLEGIATESNRIKSIEAATGQRTAATGEANVGLRREELGVKQGDLALRKDISGKPKILPAHYDRAFQQAISEMIPIYGPDMAKMFERNPKTGRLEPKQDQLTGPNGPLFQNFMKDARKRALKSLGATGDEGESMGNMIPPEDTESVGEYSPLREDF